MKSKSYLIGLLLICIAIGGFANPPADTTRATESEIQHSFYLLGNTAGIDPNSEVLKHLEQAINAEKQLFSVLYLGDLVNQNGVEKPMAEADAGRLRRLMHIADDNDQGQVYFLPGDQDWANSGENGRKSARLIEKFIEDELDYKGVFLPGKGCPGPKILDLNEQVRVVVINTQWWLHPYDRPEAPETDCKVLTEHDFWEEMESVIEDSDGKSLIFAGHHPVYSKGQYAGKRLLKKHLFPLTDKNPNLYIPLPIYGSFYAGYRQNVGTPADMANEKYKQFRYKLYSMLRDHQSLVYLSGHEYDLEAHILDGNFHINSGSATRAEPLARSRRTLFKKSTVGYAKLVYYTNGSVDLAFYGKKKGNIQLLSQQQLFASACEVMGENGKDGPRKGGQEPSESVVHSAKSYFPPLNLRYIPCQEEVIAASEMNPIFRDSSHLAVGGAEYKAGAIKKLMLGKHYRTSWTAPLQIPYLDLDKEKGGLEAFAKGGGRQTLSIKFTAGDGAEYVFRSVNKNPAKAVPPELRETVLLDLLKDQTTTQHPYGALVTDHMLDAIGILHAKPRLFLLPDDPKLGQFQPEFANLFGMLEERPKGKNKVDNPFHEADVVLRSVQMFRELYEDNDHSVDALAFAKARLFDIMIGDWGRHEDNWKWAGYEQEDNEVVYQPIPRDRDHSFSRWDGILPWLADREWLRPNIENFDDKFHNIKNLTWPARHLDRRLLSGVSWEEFEQLAKEVQSEITDEVIAASIANLPGNDTEISGPEIAFKLKSRRDDLLSAAKTYYGLLARQVDVVGSNKFERFEVNRNPDGSVAVKVYKLTKNKRNQDKLLFERIFFPAETKEINLYGLGGKDDFVIGGAANESILIRVISGDGKDEIKDLSSVAGNREMTRIYDARSKDKVLENSGEATVIRPDKELKYDWTAFKYNTYFPIPLLTYSVDDGFGVGLSIGFTNYAFDKPDYASKHSIKALGTTNGSFQLGYSGMWRHAVGKWDFGISGTFDFPDQSYPHFYGLGNETVKNDSLFSENYYRLILRQLKGEASLNRTFWRKSFLGLRANVLRNSAGSLEGASEVFEEIMPYGFDVNTMLGSGLTLDIDFRDGSTFSTRGIRFLFRHDSYLNLTGEEEKPFGNTEIMLSYYGTARLGLPVTLALTGGYADTYGKVPFFKMNALGRNNHLRGFYRNRFIGNSSAYLNGELRFHMGTLSTPVVPLNVGLIGFYDQGRVWLDGETSDTWHNAYGGGIYFAPLSRDYTFRFDVAWSDEESLFFQFGMGLFLK